MTSSRDRTTFIPEQKEAFIGTIIPAISTDYPGRITIGPAFFESFQTWPGFKFTYGLNYANLAVLNSTAASVPYICRALKSNLLAFEFGNEPDLFVLFRVRNATTWTDTSYVKEWTTALPTIRNAALTACPTPFALYGPTFAGLARGSLGNLTVLDPTTSWQAGLNAAHSIHYLATHHYMAVSTAPGVTLQGTLLNATAIRSSVSSHTSFHARLLASDPSTPPLVLGEHNSLALQGRAGISDTFGAALWNLAFNAQAAASGVKRQHMHQGTNYRYQLWQPVATNYSKEATKAPYYGNVALAEFIGKNRDGEVRVADLGLGEETGAVLGAWETGQLRRVLVVDLRGWNATRTGPRPRGRYELDLMGGRCEGGVRRLSAAGSDATSGVTWDGISYDFEKGRGKPVRVAKRTGEKVQVDRGEKLVVEVPWSSAVIIDCA